MNKTLGTGRNIAKDVIFVSSDTRRAGIGRNKKVFKEIMTVLWW